MSEVVYYFVGGVKDYGANIWAFITRLGGKSRPQRRNNIVPFQDGPISAAGTHQPLSNWIIRVAYSSFALKLGKEPCLHQRRSESNVYQRMRGSGIPWLPGARLFLLNASSLDGNVTTSSHPFLILISAMGISAVGMRNKRHGHG
jgi:hypothetical protein